MAVSVRTRLAAAKVLCSRCSSWPPTVPAGASHGEGFLDLAENLRLADDHGIQTGGDAEKMANGLLIVVLIDVRRKQSGVEAELAMQKAGQVGALAIDSGQHLDAVAGGDDHALCHAGQGSQGARGFGQFVARDGDALAQLDGRGFVVDSDERERHGAPNLWTWLTRLAAQTASMTTKTAPER